MVFSWIVRRSDVFVRGCFVELVICSLIFRRNGGLFVDLLIEMLVFSLGSLWSMRRSLGVTLENEAYMLGLGGAKKRKC